jgi:hypothetical protein
MHLETLQYVVRLQGQGQQQALNEKKDKYKDEDRTRTRDKIYLPRTLRPLDGSTLLHIKSTLNDENAFDTQVLWMGDGEVRISLATEKIRLLCVLFGVIFRLRGGGGGQKQDTGHQKRPHKARQGKARQGKANQGKSRQAKTRQDKTRQDKTRQDKTRQDKTRQDKTRQENEDLYLLRLI